MRSRSTDERRAKRLAAAHLIPLNANEMRPKLTNEQQINRFAVAHLNPIHKSSHVLFRDTIEGGPPTLSVDAIEERLLQGGSFQGSDWEGGKSGKNN